MAYLGYRDANLDLQRANVTLEGRNADLRRANEAAEAAKRDLESFSYSVSHDLRAPLRAIDGFSQALKEDFFSDLKPEANALLDRVRAAAQRMGHLIDDLLALSRVSRAPLALTRVDISDLARSVAAGLMQGAPNRKVDVEIDAGISVSADLGLMRIVLENLLGNAWKFTATKVEAVIRVGKLPLPEEGQTVFFVSDNGAGFDMAYSEKLFRPFERLHEESEFHGTGIGLATVQRVVARHGGRAWAEAAVGTGARFFFTLGGDARSPP
jgi:light-regulated signal transduction histidine kinase (bacteriophytochrome)